VKTIDGKPLTLKIPQPHHGPNPFPGWSLILGGTHDGWVTNCDDRMFIVNRIRRNFLEPIYDDDREEYRAAEFISGENRNRYRLYVAAGIEPLRHLLKYHPAACGFGHWNPTPL